MTAHRVIKKLQKKEKENNNNNEGIKKVWKSNEWIKLLIVPILIVK